MDSRSLIIIRGMPGAGKTTLARLLSEKGKYPIFSVDDYFTHPESGDYQFKFDENHKAYRLCEENTKAAMVRNEPKIILHNVFSYDWEMKPYFLMAEELQYRVFVMTLENRHGGENLHGISREQMEKMASGFQLVLF